jgi:hypothetical protein
MATNNLKDIKIENCVKRIFWWWLDGELRGPLSAGGLSMSLLVIFNVYPSVPSLFSLRAWRQWSTKYNLFPGKIPSSLYCSIAHLFFII